MVATSLIAVYSYLFTVYCLLFTVYCLLKNEMKIKEIEIVWSNFTSLLAVVATSLIAVYWTLCYTF